MSNGNGGLGGLSLALALLGLVAALALHFLPGLMGWENPALWTRYASYAAFALGGLALILGLAGRGSGGAGAGTGLGALLVLAAAAYTVMTWGIEAPTAPPVDPASEPAAEPATGTTANP